MITNEEKGLNVLDIIIAMNQSTINIYYYEKYLINRKTRGLMFISQ